MNGHTAGLESDDPSGKIHHQLRVWRNACSAFNLAALAACTVGEHQLQRLAEDAAARAISEVEKLDRKLALHIRSLDGQDPQNAG